MTDSTRISVIVPAYNAAATIAQTLDCILAQTLPPSEIVVVDDGSKDDTLGVLERYVDRVRVLQQPNSGPSAARNYGVAETQGDWIAFCDADDVWHPEKLRVIRAVLSEQIDADLLFHDFWTIVDDRIAEAHATHSSQTMFPLFREFDISIPRILANYAKIQTGTQELGAVETWHGSAFRWLMLGNFLMPSTVTIRRSAFEEVGGFDPDFRHAEDTEFFLRFAKARPMLWVDCSLTGYRRTAGSLLSSSMYPTTRNGARAVEKHCVQDAAVYNGPDAAWVRRAVARRFTRLAYFCLSELNTADARTWARTALSHRPTDVRAWVVWLGSFVGPEALQAVRRAREFAKQGSRN